jgi:hypothetical protein
MARLPRVNPIGVAQHIIQRGNNRQNKNKRVRVTLSKFHYSGQVR